MKPSIWMVLLLAVAPVWAQHARNTVNATRAAKSGSRASRPVLSRAVKGAAAAAADSLPQAPGVVQYNLLDASNVVWFVTAEDLPSGTQLSPFLAFPDTTVIPLDTLTLTEDIPAGSSFDLPNIRRFGPFWPQGLLAYGVVVNRNGEETQTAADFPVDSARNYDDVVNMVPRITSLIEGVADGNVFLTIRGSFTRNRAYILIEDLVPPRDAINVTTSEITVNLSAVPGLDLGIMQDLLVTVGQGGWCDTAVLRHVPPRPGTYNPAPQ